MTPLCPGNPQRGRGWYAAPQQAAPPRKLGCWGAHEKARRSGQSSCWTGSGQVEAFLDTVESLDDLIQGHLLPGRVLLVAQGFAADREQGFVHAMQPPLLDILELSAHLGVHFGVQRFDLVTQRAEWLTK